MIEKKEEYIFNEEENVIMKSFSVMKDGMQIAKGFVGIFDTELLEIYANNAEFALKDFRTIELLSKQ